ncbi:MBL fold metallo-hydrolase [Crocosphaera watsonii WH 8501]|uniref:Zn-dependent hydrolase n=6 Tax=Crocosphaera TaxID=263510 RepID=Q4C9S3_CROWT|nr:MULTISPECIES: MBL fold metallo-hydrolase [Crocosphaera]EAM53213.1 periplasmic protein, function unknown [Crocosphaera watsonii WH 8501]EHJ14882.1 periplasmic protein, function unknown [Crocosphaera watsonii WH 0003]MCH2246190.1 MBL fold metallo-hydrolase [Crocosphaera sp.]CCQ51054.1 periplasmic protein, function unknown [Crocosphaera watsonii WH 8502]CCQ57268.1 periplasmic protein, function unknown [Crocosphaera watsonii WH 0005]
MKRRQFMRYAGASAMAATGLSVSSRFQTVSAQSKDSLSIQYLGHTAFLFTGGGIRILANPFRAIGCTAGYRLPRVEADLVIISSQMWDEGAAENLPGNPKVLYEPGVYEINGFRLQGVGIAHDRQGGKRFGTNVAWRWTQGGIRVVHLGGAAAPIDIEQKILLGSPDVALIPVGGGPKAYNANEGKQAMETLRPKVMIPTHYRTSAADEETCDIDPLAGFLNLVEDMNIKQVNNNQLRLRFEDLPKEGTLIRVLNYKPALKA